MPELATLPWVVLGVGAALIGISKTAIPGLGTVAVALFAAVLPARASTAAILLLLILADVFALAMYRRHADWPTLLRLFPAVVVGLLLGAIFLALADDAWVRRGIGVILLLLMAVTVWRRFRPLGAPRGPLGQRLQRWGYGSLSGFTTMVANAGGAAMSMYMLAARFPVHAFLGTAAWFFAILNLSKVPISLGLGLITPSTLLLDLLLAPAVVIGALLGKWIAARIKQQAFEWAVIGFTTLGAIYLVL